MEDKAMTKVKDLTPASKQVNVLVKVVILSEEREITSKFGEARTLVEATVDDETVAAHRSRSGLGRGGRDRDRRVRGRRRYSFSFPISLALVPELFISLSKQRNRCSSLGQRPAGIHANRISGVVEVVGFRAAPASGKS